MINTIKDILDDLKDIKVLVVGETIIDEYQYGYTLGKAGKFPIVAFKNEHKEIYHGGVKAIENHLRDFCNVDVYTGENVIVKKRYIEKDQKLFETYDTKFVSHGYKGDKPIPRYEDYDVVIVADFGHGFITEDMRLNLATKSNYLALNCQHNAGNMGMNTINKYIYADYVSIDKLELRLANSDQFGDIEDVMRSAFQTIQTASVTLGEEGSKIYKNDEIINSPSMTSNVTDSVGAGDAYLAITSLLAYKDLPAEEIGFIGNCAGAIACSYQGNKEYITKEKLLDFIEDRI